MARHSKKFILEAIEHWENALRQLCESEDKLFGDFIEEFGIDAVFYDGVKMTVSNAQKIYEIADRDIFKSKLKMPDIVLKDNSANAYAAFNYAFRIANGSPEVISKKWTSKKSGKTFYPPQIRIAP